MPGPAFEETVSGDPGDSPGKAKKPVMADCGEEECESRIVGAGTDDEFDLGNPSDNVGIDPDDGALIVETGNPDDPGFMWIADTKLPGAVKIDLATMEIVGHYYTGGDSTSRTTINSLGEAFVASRKNGPYGKHGVTKILPHGTGCPDTNGDGVITTSMGVGDVLPWGEDDCVLWHTELEGDARGIAAQDLPGLSADVCDDFDPKAEFADEPPAPAPDEHYVWVGGTHGRLYKLDAETGEILVNIASPHPVYGGALDGSGRFWIAKTLSYVDTLKCVDSAACDAEPVCESSDWATFDKCVDDGAIKARKIGTNGYGITVDCKQRVWMSSATQRYDPSLPVGARHALAGAGSNSGLGGIAADAHGYIWASSGAETARVDGDTLEAVRVPAPDKGVAVAPDGRVITVRSNSVHVIEPGATLADFTVHKDAITLPGTAYAYSDMTGVQARLAANEPGYYRQIFKGCEGGKPTSWEELLYDIDVPEGTFVRFRVRSADKKGDLKDEPFRAITCDSSAVSGEGAGSLEGLEGAFIEVEVQLSASQEIDGTQKGCGIAPATSARIHSFGPVLSCPKDPDMPQ